MVIVISGMVGMSGMLRISRMLKILEMSGQISSVIPFRNHNLELILMKMRVSGMSGMTEILIMSGLQVSYLFGTTSSS